MEVIGLTGGIGTGKSTVSGMLSELGAIVVDADEAARAVVEPGMPALGEIVREFGPELIAAGRLDRARLAELVFPDPGRRRRLEAIVWPRVREWMAERVREAAATGAGRVVMDIPLLFEARNPDEFAAVIVVSAPEEEQVRRLVLKGLPESDARARIASQLPIADKVRRATYVVDNSGSREETQRQVAIIWATISDG